MVQCVAVCCSKMQRVVVCMLCRVMKCVVQRGAAWCSVLQCVAVCCSVLQCVAAYYTVCYSEFQCTVACCSALQCVAVRWLRTDIYIPFAQ